MKMQKIKEEIIDFVNNFGSKPNLKLRKKQIELLKNQSIKRKGTLHTSIISGEKYFTFRHHEMNISIGYKEAYQAEGEYLPETTVRMELNSTTNIKLIIYSKEMGTFQSLMMDVHNIETGNHIFDDKFIVKGNDRDFTLNLLQSEIQEKLLELENKYNYPIVKLRKNKFILMLRNYLFEEKEYDELVDITLMFLDRLRLLGCIDISIKV